MQPTLLNTLSPERPNVATHIDKDVFRFVGEVADNMGRECYVVGGYVRDLLLGRPSKDIDFVTVGSGIELATEVAERLGSTKRLHVYRSYGTAQVVARGMELEFVGARRESYHRESRNPVVEDGTLKDDLSRRDFTINALAASVNASNFGDVIDIFDGLNDLRHGIIRTPLDPDITFSDDPLRMMRAIRFATQLNFEIHPETLEAITRNAERISIITVERITTEINKIMMSAKPSIGWTLLLKTGLLQLIFPKLAAMQGVEVVKGRGHKDNFYHTLGVLDNVAEKSDNLWLRWAALLHDIGKPYTKRWDDNIGWTFHNHNLVGAKMVPGIFASLKLPMGSEMKYVQQMVDMHMRPIALVEDEVTDSAVRRLINYAEDKLHDLMILARADITSRNHEKKQRFLDNFDLVERKFADINAKDADRKFRTALNGEDIMRIFGIPQSPLVGYFMGNMLQAAKDDLIPNTPQGNYDYLIELAKAKEIPVVCPMTFDETTSTQN